MQIKLLSPYNKKVPKFEARVTVSRELGSAAILSWLRYPKVDQKPCGKAWIVASVGALASPNTISSEIQPSAAEITASVQMARCGVRFLVCSTPRFPDSSPSLPIA